MLLSSDLGSYMFNIPQRTPISASNPSVIMVVPFWYAQYPDYHIRTACVSPHVWNDTPEAQQDLNLSILAGRGLYSFTPSRDREKCAVVTTCLISDELFDYNRVQFNCRVSGFRRVVWAKRSHDLEMIMISSCPYVTSSFEGCRGALRLGRRTDEALPQWNWNIEIPKEGWPRSLCWDEETGRICVLVDYGYGAGTCILVIDV